MMDGAFVAMDGGAAVEIANAVKASGAIVRVEPVDFDAILRKTESPLVVCAMGGVFSRKYRYLTSYKGLVFYTQAPSPLPLPSKTEMVTARKIWVPE